MTTAVVVQRIDTQWTKRTRDAAGRELRARLPQAYALPDALLHTTDLCVRHFVERSEPDFEVREWVEHDDTPTTGRGGAVSVRLRMIGDELEVVFVGSDAGAPRRYRRMKRIPAGSWMRVRYNGRFLSSNGRGPNFYEDKIVNVAFRTDLRATMFSGIPPFELDALADLW